MIRLLLLPSSTLLPRMHVALDPVAEGKEPAGLTVPSKFLRDRLGVAGITSIHMPLARTLSQDHANWSPVARRGRCELLAREKSKGVWERESWALPHS